MKNHAGVKKKELTGLRSLPVHMFDLLIKVVYWSSSFNNKIYKESIGEALSDKEVISKYAKSTKGGVVYFESSDLMKSMELKKDFEKRKR